MGNVVGSIVLLLYIYYIFHYSYREETIKNMNCLTIGKTFKKKRFIQIIHMKKCIIGMLFRIFEKGPYVV